MTDPTPAPLTPEEEADLRASVAALAALPDNGHSLQWSNYPLARLLATIDRDRAAPSDERFVRLATAVMELRQFLALHRKATGRSDVNIRKVLRVLDQALADNLAARLAAEENR